MPATNGHPDQYLRDTIHKILARLAALELQQNFGVTDQNGVQRVVGGLLPNGDYGFQVTGADGVTTAEVNPTYAVESTDGQVTTSSTSFVTLDTLELVVPIGATGGCIVTTSAVVSTPDVANAINAGLGALYVDGTFIGEPLVVQVGCGASATGLEMSAEWTIVLGPGTTFGPLTPGDHTFTLKYSAGSSGGTAGFNNRVISVIPT